MCVCVLFILLILLEPSPFRFPDLHFHVHDTPGQIEVPAVNGIETEGLLAAPLNPDPFTPSQISSGDAKNLGQNSLEKVGEIFDMPGLHEFAASVGTL